MATYIWERDAWPKLRYDPKTILNPLSEAVEEHGLLIGRLEGLGFGDLQNTKLDAISTEVVKSSEIEGERLDYDSVRSSIAKRLGIDAGENSNADPREEGVVEMALDATENSGGPLTAERLITWQAGLFPGGRGPLGRIKIGGWRDGPMQVVSGAIGREKEHFEAPPADRLAQEMENFLAWFECDDEPNGILKAGIAHFWFVTIHPFDDGNGRVGRAILDLQLARYDHRRWRCYSVSSQIRQERNQYYDALERAQKGNLDITTWLVWYLGCLARALKSSAENISTIIRRSRFWQHHANKNLNERQRKVLRRMLMGWQGKMTSEKWQKLTNTIPRTALRDLTELVEMGIFEQQGAGRGTSYNLIWPDDV